MRSWFCFDKRALRERLTAWYVLLVGLTLLLFSGYLYVQLEHNLLAQADNALQVAASQSLANLDDESSPPAFLKTESYQDTALHLSQAGFAVRLIAPNGQFWDGFGAYGEVPTWKPTASGYATLTKNNIHWRVYSQRIKMPDGRLIVWLQVARSLSSVYEASESLRTQILLGLPLVLLFTGVGGMFLAERALRPIDRITRTAQTISASDLSQRIGYRGPADEVGRLATTLDRMLERLQAGFNRERRFAADASHELRTPLTVIKGRIGVTLSRPRTRTEYESTLQDLEQQVDRLIRLSNGLLFFARLEQRRLRWQRSTLDLSDLLGAIVEQVQPLAEVKNITLNEDIPSGLFISGDLDHLTSLFLNLLDNAIKYTLDSGQITVWAEHKNGSVRVAVSDTGPGIPAEHLPQIFERFYRVEAARDRSTGGAGLGLAIAHEIVRLHQGTLEAQSELNRGTTVIVHLPIQPPREPIPTQR